MPTGQAHRCQDGQPSLDHGRAGDAISEGIYMRISPTFVILFGSPGYHWNHNEETFTEFQPWLIVNVCVFNEKTSLAFITKAWVGRNKRSNLYLMEVQKYYVSFSSAQFCVQMTELSKSWLQATATAMWQCYIVLLPAVENSYESSRQENKKLTIDNSIQFIIHRFQLKKN